MDIGTSCELLAEGDLQSHQREQIEHIGGASEEMRDLVQTFLQLARDKANESALVGNSSLAQVAAEQTSRWEPLLHEKGLDFQRSQEGADHGLYNPVLLNTGMANLLRNALHYTERGFVRLVLVTDGFRLEDSGMGIAPEQHEQIFQPFVGGSETRGEGLRPSLSLVKRICSKRGWTILAHNLTDGGSCFTVAFNSAT